MFCIPVDFDWTASACLKYLFESTHFHNVLCGLKFIQPLVAENLISLLDA